MLETLKQQFIDRFGQPGKAYFAPGRVNLIGEHIDYNGGLVFPCAITYGTYAVASLREDKYIHFYSNNFKEIGLVTTSIDDLFNNPKDDWANYAKGVIKMLQNDGHVFQQGFNVLIEGNIPNGAGLSSSASLEVLIGTIVNDLYQLGLDPVTIVKVSQRAENEFVGMNCGIMDQFVIGMGKQDHAIALNTATLEYEYAPIELKDSSIVIMNTNKRRGLADSKYNQRRAECDQACALLHAKFLCEADLEQAKQLKDETLRKRAVHAISENQRVHQAIEALNRHDLEAFGQLMNQSHLSLEKDYEVTGIELDTLVHLAWQQDGVLGARMTGAGFGGCAIAIVKNDNIEAFKQAVKQGYTETIGYEPTFYIASVGDGAKVCD